MARLRTIACEQDFNTKDSIDGESSGGAGITVDTSVFRISGASARFPGATTVTSFATAFFTGATATDYYARVYFRYDATVTANGITVLALKTAAGALIGQVVVGVGPSHLALFDSLSSQVGSASAATLVINTWYSAELHAWVPTSGNGTLEARLDGTLFATSTAANVGTAAPGQLAFGCATDPGQTVNVWVDDVALNDGSGSAQNSWPGFGHIILLKAISDNQVGSWTAGAGGTTSLFSAISPGIGSSPFGISAETNSSQIKRLAQDTLGTEYRANLQSYTNAGLVSTTDTITLVHPLWNDGEEVLTGTKTGAVALTSNPVSSSTTTFTFGDDVGALGTYPTNWKTHWGDAGSVVYNPSVTFGLSPVIKVNKTDAGTAEGDIDYLVAAVEYVTGPARANPPTTTAASGTGEIKFRSLQKNN